MTVTTDISKVRAKLERSLSRTSAIRNEATKEKNKVIKVAQESKRALDRARRDKANIDRNSRNQKRDIDELKKKQAKLQKEQSRQGSDSKRAQDARVRERREFDKRLEAQKKGLQIAEKGQSKLAKEIAETRKPSWIEGQLDRIPGWKQLREFAKTTASKAITFFKNTGAAIDLALDKVPAWKALKGFAGTLFKWGQKGIDLITKFLQHPAIQKILGFLGLAANVFSIGSSIAQWASLFQLQNQFNKFTDTTVSRFNKDYERLINLILPIKKQVEQINKDAPVTKDKIRAIETVVPEIIKTNQRALEQLKGQKSQLDAAQKALTFAVTANVMNLAISKAIAPGSTKITNLESRVGKLEKAPNPGTLKEIKDLDTRVGRLEKTPSPGTVKEIKGLETRVGKLETAPSPATVREIQTLREIVRQVQFKPGQPGPKGADGKDGAPGLTTVLTLPGTPGKPGLNGRNGIDATMDPETKAKINTILAIVQAEQTKTSAIAQSAATAAQAASTAASTAAINSMKLGEQVTGGISGFLGRIQQFSEIAWKATRLDKLMGAITMITTVHNAAMLSQNVGSTLGDAASQSLSVIGIKDEKGNAIDVNGILAKNTEDFIKGLIGADAYNGVAISWQKANTIIRSGANILWTVRSMADSARDVAEWTAENTGKIGNALKSARIVGENAYKWMPERVTQQGKWTQKVNRMVEKLDNVDDAAGSFQGVLSDVESTQDNIKDLTKQREDFVKSLKDALPKDRDDNTSVKTAADQSNAVSASPTLSIADRQRGA